MTTKVKQANQGQVKVSEVRFPGDQLEGWIQRELNQFEAGISNQEGDMDDKDLLGIKRFDGTNFHVWKFQMRIGLKVKGLLDVVEGKAPRPETPGPTRVSWDEKDVKAQAHIMTTLDYKQVAHLVNCKSSKEMWSKLESIHERKNAAAKTLIQGQFYEYKMDSNKSMSDNLAVMEGLVSQLSSLEIDMDDSAVTSKVISSLPAAFSHFVCAWNLQPEDNKSMESLTAGLLQEESRLKKLDNDHEREEVAFLVRKRGLNLNKRSTHDSGESTSNEISRGSNKFVGVKTKKKCFNCQKTGHFARDCRVKRNDYDRRPKPSDQGGSKGNDQLAMTASYSLLAGHSNDSWIIDSGATEHMTNRKDWLQGYKEFDFDHEIGVAKKGLSVKGKGSGIMQIKARVQGKTLRWNLHDTLYVPDLPHNLYSIKAATKHGCSVRFFDDGSVIVIKNNKTVIRGKLVDNGLYQLDVFPVKSSQANEAGSSSAATLRVWHRRLGHLNYQYLKEMVRKQSVKGLNIKGEDTSQGFCEGCVYGKHTRKSFKLTNRKKKDKPGKLIHVDLCGPMNVVSNGGKKYFILFKDDCTDYRIVYPLKDKNEVMDRFKDFLIRVKNDLGNQCLCIRTDNGLEFCNKSIERLLRDHGVKHETSTSYCPEQNGVIERDNRTVVESARSLLYSTDLEEKFWAEAVCTAVYLLNRTSNKRLQGRTPCELWTGSVPDVSHIRVFGSLAYKQVPSIHRKKWNRKSEKRILVGFEENKSYRLLNPDTHKIEFSGSVIFNENTGIERDIVFWNDTLDSKTQETDAGNEESSQEEDDNRVDVTVVDTGSQLMDMTAQVMMRILLYSNQPITQLLLRSPDTRERTTRNGLDTIEDLSTK